ncbi:hypothetical protein [Novosphingobium sp. CF614]|uniref:hypothetical protein n=1 Tax=Novosphingobium sp. CF614 TaxID=1884364 RepID=UPI0011606616|nr:hypothetical protein [Novosphingobium sp. CF614]
MQAERSPTSRRQRSDPIRNVARGNLAKAVAIIASTGAHAERNSYLAQRNAVSREDEENSDVAANFALEETATQRAAARAAAVNLGSVRVRAAILGRIGGSTLTPGALVQAGQAAPLTVIQRTDQIYVDIPSAAAMLSFQGAVGCARSGSGHPMDVKAEFRQPL